MSTQFNGRIFTFTQPDGSTIQLRGFGDQNYAVFETLDGYTVTQNPATGYYEVAQLSPDGNALQPAAAAADPLDGAASGVPRGLRVRRASAMAAARESARLMSGRRCDQRREEKRQQLRIIRGMAAAGGPMLAPPQRQTVGDFVGLCLLIDFSDSPATIPREESSDFAISPAITASATVARYSITSTRTQLAVAATPMSLPLTTGPCGQRRITPTKQSPSRDALTN